MKKTKVFQIGGIRHKDMLSLDNKNQFPTLVLKPGPHTASWCNSITVFNFLAFSWPFYFVLLLFLANEWISLSRNKLDSLPLKLITVVLCFPDSKDRLTAPGHFSRHFSITEHLFTQRCEERYKDFKSNCLEVSLGFESLIKEYLRHCKT